jgi:hypothetical protein
MSITKGIDELASKFIDGDYDIGLLLSHEPELSKRIGRWLASGRISVDEAMYLTNLLKPFDGINYKGTIAGAVRLYHNTEVTQNYLNTCWNDINSYVHPIRLDEVPSTLALEKVNNMKIMPLPTSLIQGDAFLYHKHKNNELRQLTYDKTKYWLKNKKVTPVFIGDVYRRSYVHRMEAMCLTKYLDANSLKEWIDHHLGIGFDHIHIFDNESTYECKAICDTYGDKVSYDFISGYARHYKLYDDYVNSDRCKAEWIMAIDDDEYLSLNQNMCANLNDCIAWYIEHFPHDHMFAIRWKHMFPERFHTDCHTRILDYCTVENPELAAMFQPMGDRGVKTLVHRIGKIHYEEAEENPTGGHVPVHSLCNGARLFNGEIVTKCSCKKIPDTIDEPARLIHCRYKGYTWYKNKYMDPDSPTFCYGNCSPKPYIKHYKFTKILETLE